MRNFISFLLAALCACGTRGLAQNYVPFPTANALWCEQFLPRDDMDYQRFYYAIPGTDTVINAKTYHKVYRSTDTVFQESEYYGGIREDSAKRVYFYGYSGLFAWNEGVLYDFSVQLGDTLKHDYNNSKNNWMVDLVVIAVDSVLIGNQYHRRIYFNWPVTYYPSVWVEGIGGSARGLLFSSGTYPNNGMRNDLLCFRQDGAWLYHNPAFPFYECVPLSGQGVAETSGRDKGVRVFPNPVTGSSTLQWPADGRFRSLTISDAAGRIIGSYGLKGESARILSRESFRPGIYFYRLSGDRSDLRGKFVVE